MSKLLSNLLKTQKKDLRTHLSLRLSHGHPFLISLTQPVPYPDRFPPTLPENLRKLVNIPIGIRPRPQRETTRHPITFIFFMVPVQVQLAQIFRIRGPLQDGQLDMVHPLLTFLLHKQKKNIFSPSIHPKTPTLEGMSVSSTYSSISCGRQSSVSLGLW